MRQFEVLFAALCFVNLPRLSLVAQAASRDQVIRPELVITTDAGGGESTVAKLTVSVRELRAPTTAVRGAQVSLTAGDSSRAWAAAEEFIADSSGIVTLHFAASGYHELRVRRIGYPPLRVRLWLPTNCQNTLEVYMVLVWCDIGACPPPPPARATLTTCRAKAA